MRLPALAVGLAIEHAARAVLLAELGILRVVRQLRLFLGVEVVEVAVELIKTVHRRQVLVAVAQVILAELTRGVAERLEQLGDGRVFLPAAELRARQAHLGQARANAVLAGDERRATGGAALLAVVVGELHALLGEAVDVRSAIPHQAVGVGADVRLADVVAPDDHDVGLLLGLGGGTRVRRYQACAARDSQKA